MEALMRTWTKSADMDLCTQLEGYGTHMLALLVRYITVIILRHRSAVMGERAQREWGGNAAPPVTLCPSEIIPLKLIPSHDKQTGTGR